jgi:elongation factor G
LKEYGPGSIRNIAFAGHGGAGKSSLTEMMLYTAHETNRIGTISEGNTVSDYSPYEIEKQISITLSALHVEWKETKINIIDTPGYSDFVGEVKSGLKVVDTAVLVVKAVEGVEVGCEVAQTFIEEYKLPWAVIINKVDSEHSKFEEAYNEVKEKLSPNVVIVSFPAHEGLNFNTVIDVVKMKAIKFEDAAQRKYTESEIPNELKSKAEEYRTQLIEKVAELNEDLMNKYF